MSKLILALGAASLVAAGLTSTASSADELKGRVTAVIADDKAVVMDDGKTYQFPATVEFTGIAPGDTLTLTYALVPTDAGPEVDNAPKRVVSKVTKG